ncbi:hypothetical protein VOLCADRAFT_107223 [Volvox carteri f. nagariensis]|uniref:Uncharacterized protein n=1 Tax=Volvox carteri f. nagariensis TaxID=3068 RepID=D8UCP9_VOLCA|nr:uncharacterized protein VOLCADRAFT_107223 [Volvox carteri f. nagariensis]EFJ42589.1 hypothetical protein VOLCADRAFT_107223 [Volvox carteri f. nagariensis]|eukprot:XP_002956445.1 hypothetical protein VOLCADRAFT_107223 [Volvox carteri f. nagariensis]
MEVAFAPKEAAAARPATGPSVRSSFLRMAWWEGLRRAIHLLLRAAARFRRLLQVLARQPGTLVRALFRSPGSLLNLVRWVLSSRPARLLLATAASLICITLQYHRPTVADIQLSSSLSLLFGMFRLQGSLAVQLGPPESRNSRSEDPNIRVQQQQHGGDELRINCPKDLKESIVRFLESQATRNSINHLTAATAAATAQSPTTAAAAATGTAGQQQRQQHLCSPPKHHRQQQQVEVEQQRPYVTEVEEAALRSTVKYPPGGFTLPEVADVPRNPWEAVADGAAAVPATADPAVVEADEDAGSYSSADSTAGGGCGFESCCSDSFPVGAPAAGLPVATRTTHGTAAAPVLSSVDALLPSTPPLGCSPAANVAGGSGIGAAECQEKGPMDRSEFRSLMSYASSYKSSVAARPNSPRRELASHGLPVAFDGVDSQEARAAAMVPVAGPASAAPACGNDGSGGVSGGGCVTLHKSPESILGLQNLGLEGWVESHRRWESRYLED